MFCLAVRYLLHHFIVEILVSLSLKDCSSYITCKRQDMTNKIMQHLYTTQTLLLTWMLNAYMQQYQKLDVSRKQILEVPAASFTGQKSTLPANNSCLGIGKKEQWFTCDLGHSPLFPLLPHTLLLYLVSICCITQVNHKNL